MRRYLLALAVLIGAFSIYAQVLNTFMDQSVTCSNGDVLTYSSANKNFYCKTPSSGSVPTGSIVLIDSGTCPSGFTEDASLDARYALGTIAAHSDIGGTGGSTSYTPAGTNNAPTVSATGTKFTTSGSGTPALTAFNGTTIASGSNTLTIPAETFTGTGATITPPYLKVIACKAN